MFRFNLRIPCGLPQGYYTESSLLSAKCSEADMIPCGLPQESSFFEKDMLHHINNPEKALAEIKRVTKEGGKLL